MSNIKETYTVQVQKEPRCDELYFELPEELLEKIGWRVGDDIEFHLEAGGCYLRKMSEGGVEN